MKYLNNTVEIKKIKNKNKSLLIFVFEIFNFFKTNVKFYIYVTYIYYTTQGTPAYKFQSN